MIKYGINKNSSETIILLPGLPYYPRPEKFIKNLIIKGFNVIYIRYSGTYESEGLFLKEDPAIMISKLITYLKTNGTFIELYANITHDLLSSKVIIIGNSFGGGVAFSILKHNCGVDRLIALSPVINSLEYYKMENKFEEAQKLKRFLLKGFKNIFRFEESDYDKMVTGNKIISIDTKNIKVKTNIFMSEDDNVVPKNHLDSFSFSKNVIIKILKSSGHLSFDSLNINELTELINN